ncbi:MAG: TlpA family protein disulfide reductase [Steroidobacteraceae bacterium]|nr:TlpA family protein disulfide reductase [Steroidobacteraceae bacterium]
MRGGSRHAIVVAVALAAGIAAFLVSRKLLEPEPAPPPTLQPAVIPDLRPDITLADRDGVPRALSEWDGKPLVINFWATWCAPCRREIPMLNALARDKAAAGFEVIGIAIDFRDAVLEFLETTPLEYAVLIGEQDGMDAARAFGMATVGLPFTAFTDRQGRIATLHVGELHRPQAEVILSAVEALDAGGIDMATARQQIRDGLAKLPPDS